MQEMINSQQVCLEGEKVRGKRHIGSAVNEVNPVAKFDPGEFADPSCSPLVCLPHSLFFPTP